MSDPIMPTGRQNRAVLRRLQSGRPICGTQTKFEIVDDFKPWHGVVTIRRVAARINDLRKLGWNIETVKWCDMHDHPESRQIMYRLVSE